MWNECVARVATLTTLYSTTVVYVPTQSIVLARGGVVLCRAHRPFKRKITGNSACQVGFCALMLPPPRGGLEKKVVFVHSTTVIMRSNEVRMETESTADDAVGQRAERKKSVLVTTRLEFTNLPAAAVRSHFSPSEKVKHQPAR